MDSLRIKDNNLIKSNNEISKILKKIIAQNFNTLRIFLLIILGTKRFLIILFLKNSILQKNCL